jgi:type IV pilus assembly protein PilP
MKAQLLLGLMLLNVASGCEDDVPPPPPPPAPGAEAAPAPGAPPKDQKGATKTGEPTDLPPLPPVDIAEKDFLESPSNRDPFRNYADLFVVKPVATELKSQRDVLIQKHSLEAIKIVGIVTGTAARVLVTDPEGIGWVLRVGDFVGKPEVVRSGGPGGGDVAVNWRVDKIRTNDVVFVRETPDPSAPATTRVLSLRSQDELRQEIRTGIRGTRPDERTEEAEPEDRGKAPPNPKKK